MCSFHRAGDSMLRMVDCKSVADGCEAQSKKRETLNKDANSSKQDKLKRIVSFLNDDGCCRFKK